MACKCCQQYAPKHHDGSPLPPCAGTEAIEEARDFARLWRKRAMDIGWMPTIKSLAVVTAVTSSAWEGSPDDVTIQAEGFDEDGNPVVETTHQGQDPIVTHSTDDAPPTTVRLRGRDQHGNQVEEELTVGQETVTSKHAYRGMSWQIGDETPPAKNAHPGPTAPLKEKMAAHLAECIAHGEDLIYCQGPDRHHAIVGSPMGETLVERGCFHCGAFPEIQA